MKQDLKDLAQIILVWKLMVLLLIWLSVQLLPFCTGCRLANFLYPRDEPLSVLSAFKTWDSQYYLYVAENGYMPGMINNAAHPLFPFLMKILSFLFKGNLLVTGLVFSNLFSLAALVWMYKWVKSEYGVDLAFRSCLFLAFFPTGFYLNLVYAESLFLLLLVIFFWALYKDKKRWLFLSSMLLPLTRAQGVLALVPLLIHGLIKKHKMVIYGLFGFMAGWLIYLLIMKSATGSFWSGYMSHKMNVSQFSASNLLRPWVWFKINFVQVNLSLHGFNTSIINRCFFVLGLVIMAWGVKLLDKVMWSFLAVGVMVPAMLGYFMSYPRLILAVIPMYLVIGKLAGRNWWKYLMPMLMLQVLFLIMHVLNFWVA